MEALYHLSLKTVAAVSLREWQQGLPLPIDNYGGASLPRCKINNRPLLFFTDLDHRRRIDVRVRIVA